MACGVNSRWLGGHHISMCIHGIGGYTVLSFLEGIIECGLEGIVLCGTEGKILCSLEGKVLLPGRVYSV